MLMKNNCFPDLKNILQRVTLFYFILCKSLISSLIENCLILIYFCIQFVFVLIIVLIVLIEVCEKNLALHGYVDGKEVIL